MGLKHFETQILGGLVLNEGKIAEMKTGEGKTLVATLPASFQALSGKGVHIVTVNECTWILINNDGWWMLLNIMTVNELWWTKLNVNIY